MTITAPLVTESELDQVAVDEISVELPDSGDRPTPESAEPTSLLRDPLLPFLVVGTVFLVALLVTAYLVSASGFAL